MRHCRSCAQARRGLLGCIAGTVRYADGVTDTADRPADDDTDFWLSVPGFRESLIEAEADYAAGRTFSEEEIRTKFGGYRRASLRF